MDATLNIVISVAAKDAVRQIESVDRGLRRMQSAGMGGLGNSINKLDQAWAGFNRKILAMGKNLQWVGRQLTFNFTLPLMLAGGMATKWALENERALTGLRKVYGKSGENVNMLRKEVDALAVSFELLSSRFGVSQKEVIEIGAAWAQAGSAGVAVAKQTRATLEAMIIGEMDQETAMRGLIAIQSTYRLSSSELADQLGILNAIENETAIRFTDLVSVVQKSGAAARITGVDIRHLAAMAASLVPAAGSASEAGSSLKTIFSRLLAPTKDTIDILHEIGIEIDDVGWLSMNAGQRLEYLADNTRNLTSNQVALLTSILGSRRQFNRLAQLLDDIRSKQGFYNVALEATADKQQVNAKYARELSIYLSSQPQAFAMLTQTLKNLASKAIMPLLPAIAAFLASVTEMVLAFTNLDIETQKFILGMLVTVAVIGPIVQTLGAFLDLIGVLSGAVHFLGSKLWWLAKFILPAVGSAFNSMAAVVVAATGVTGAAVYGIIAAVLAALVFAAMMFNKGFRELFIQGIIDVINVFGELPGAIADVMSAVIRVLGRAIEVVFELLSYLNPFARHSPSLVENVTNGVTEILRQYSRLNGLASTFRGAMHALQDFNVVTADAAFNAANSEYRTNRKDIVRAAGPQAGDEADRLYLQMRRLISQLAPLEAMIARQERVVTRWQRAVDRLHTAQSNLSDLLNVQITGMHDYDDAIFENEMAQKRLRLEILQMEDAGVVYDDLRNRLALLQGELESLTGTRESLRAAGAAQEVLGVYDQQIAAVEAQMAALEAQSGTVGAINDQLAQLERQAEILNLEKSINFDPQLRQIEEFINGIHEMSAAQIMSQARVYQQQIRGLAGVEERLAREEAKLEKLKDAYDSITESIQNMESALSQFGKSAAAADAAKKAAGAGQSRTAELFEAGAGGGFPIPTGTGELGREGGLSDIQQFNRDLKRELDRALEDIAGGNLFGPMQDALDGLKRSLDGIVGPFRAVGGAIEWIGDWLPRIAGWFAAIVIALNPLTWILLGIATVFYAVYKAAIFLWQAALYPFFTWLGGILNSTIMPLFRLLWSVAVMAFNAIATVAVWLWNTILLPFFGWFYETVIARFLPIWELIKTTIEIVVVVIARVCQWLWRNVLEPFFEAMDWSVGHTSEIWAALKVATGIALRAIGAVARWVWDTFLWPFFDIFWSKIQWVMDKLNWFKEFTRPVWEAIGRWASETWDKHIKPVFEAIKRWCSEVLPDVFRAFKEKTRDIFNSIKDILSGVWDFIADGLEGIVNGFIMAINAVIRGVRAIANFLNIENNMTTIDHVRLPRFHEGGVVGDEGRVSGLAPNERMAVLLKGEGVVPLDVMQKITQRQYDTLLHADLLPKPRMGYGTERGETGGFFEPLGDLVDTVADGLSGVAHFVSEQALRALWAPLKMAAQGLANAIPHRFFKDIAYGLINRIDDFVDNIGDEMTKRGIGTLPFGEPLGAPGVDTGIWRQMLDTVRRQFPDVDFFGGYANRNTATGNISRHAYGRAIDISPRMDIFNWLASNYGPRSHEIIFSPANNDQWYAGAHHFYNEPTRGDHWSHIHWSLADGALIRGGAGGILARVGEGSRDELVTPLPANFNLGDLGKKDFHFHGDLSFPNITDPNDAKEFLENLESLAS